jgi:mono/diheme cytochrome c family protein
MTTMRTGRVVIGLSVALVGVAVAVTAARGRGEQAGAAPSTAAKPAAAPKPAAGAVARGKYLVTIGGCNDCHTPPKMGPNGPEPDMDRMLSGHPADVTLPPAPALQGGWLAVSTMTAWSGPWGTSYTRNLTPDKETGLGAWTEQQFMDTIRNGRHQGRGRQLLPPMPWQNYAQMTDADLKAVFAYLRSIPPISNKVPDPVMAPPPSK